MGEKLPADFWTAPRVATALAEGDVATILAEIQRVKRWTQEDIGRILGYSQSWVSKVIRRRHYPSIRFATWHNDLESLSTCSESEPEELMMRRNDEISARPSPSHRSF